MKFEKSVIVSESNVPKLLKKSYRFYGAHIPRISFLFSVLNNGTEKAQNEAHELNDYPFFYW